MTWVNELLLSPRIVLSVWMCRCLCGQETEDFFPNLAINKINMLFMLLSLYEILFFSTELDLTVNHIFIFKLKAGIMLPDLHDYNNIY